VASGQWSVVSESPWTLGDLLATDHFFMTWIKICGITNAEDALAATNAGANALGFVFYKSSPRNIDPERVREIVAQLPPEVEKVGVFVDESPERIAEVASRAELTALQIHTGSSFAEHGQQAWCFGNRKIYFALPAALFLEAGAEWIASDQHSPALSAIFLDSGTLQQPGGTGKPFDWQKAALLVEAMTKTANVVIAGGLNPVNVAEAIRILKPWGVDVASGVEATPGKKDPKKVCAFIAAVRGTERSSDRS
jgi:phosphoribosylanthranilate isomerase